MRGSSASVTSTGGDSPNDSTPVRSTGDDARSESDRDREARAYSIEASSTVSTSPQPPAPPRAKLECVAAPRLMPSSPSTPHIFRRASDTHDRSNAKNASVSSAVSSSPTKKRSPSADGDPLSSATKNAARYSRVASNCAEGDMTDALFCVKEDASLSFRSAPTPFSESAHCVDSDIELVDWTSRGKNRDSPLSAAAHCESGYSYSLASSRKQCVP
mmetsp:Transcript_14215/g.59886  ORF Transcript_14215/g.59886 Transcript_14215/m.59886 type:complete len:216 (+) Transcript_14215:136-783(+)